MLTSAIKLSGSRQGTRSYTVALRPAYGLWIDGREVAAADGATLAVENPATREPLTTVAAAGKVDVAAAVASGRRAFESGVWSKLAPRHRCVALPSI